MKHNRQLNNAKILLDLAKNDKSLPAGLQGSFAHKTCELALIVLNKLRRKHLSSSARESPELRWLLETLRDETIIGKSEAEIIDRGLADVLYEMNDVSEELVQQTIALADKCIRLCEEEKQNT